MPLTLALLSVGCGATDTGDRPGDVGLPMGGNTAGVGGTTGLPTGGTGGTAIGGTLPCNVETVVASNCQGCHGATPIGGAPMSLVTHADFTRDYTVAQSGALRGQTMKAYEIVRIRVNQEMGTTPMPQGRTMSPADLTALNQWIAAGAPAGTGCGQMTAGTGGGSGMGGGAGSAGGVGGSVGGTGGGGTGGGPNNPTSLCDGDAAYEDIVPRDGETCYELLTHGGQTLPDTTKYTIRPGENYEQFYFNVPWPTGVQGTRFGAKFDNLSVLHHWLLFTTGLARTHGTHEEVIGTQIGDSNAQLLGGWAVGGCHVEFPPEMGLELPPQGTILNAQWHFYNSTPTPQEDGSSVVVCTVPAGTRPNTGSLTWLGTENFYGPLGMPPGRHEFNGTCPNDSQAPITIWGFWPHMHEIGVHMNSVVNRVGGGMEEVFDKPFDFNYQIHYVNNPAVVLQPGDTITSTCTFENTTSGNVAFGPSTKQEMCYQFAFSYPARALDNGAPSLIGATNVCW